MYDLARQARIQHTITSNDGFLPFYHPSYETLVFLPFSMMAYRSAYFAFIAFNMLVLMSACFVGRTALSSAGGRWRPELLLFLFFPLFLAVALGQDSILSLLLYCLTWRQLESRKDVSAGVFLALALFKFQLAIPIAILIAIRRGWRFSAGFIITSAAVVMLCIGLVGPGGMADLTRLLFSAAAAVDKSAVAQQSMNVFPAAMPTIAGLLYACGARLLPSPFAFRLLSGIFGLGLFAWCARAVRRCDLSVAVSIAILCSLLVSFHLYLYDLTLVLIPMALLSGRTHRYIVIVMLALPFLLFHFGLNWYFLMAVPMLAMLTNAILATPERGLLYR
jgi:hypothetical protein